MGLQKQTEKMKKNSIELGKQYGKINGRKTGKINIKKAIDANKVKVNQYTLSGTYVRTWNSMTEAAKNIGTYKSNISRCAKNKRGSAGGYKWKVA